MILQVGDIARRVDVLGDLCELIFEIRVRIARSLDFRFQDSSRSRSRSRSKTDFLCFFLLCI